MEPLSITATALTLAGQAWKLGYEIYQFVAAAANVDDTLKELSAEVKAIGDTCSTIHQCQYIDTSLETSINPQLQRCKGTIARLGAALPKTTPSRFRIVDKAFRQSKLNLNQRDVNECRRQIQGILTNLELSLQLINLKATYLAPQLANEALLTRLAQLDQVLESRDQRLDETLRRCADAYVTQGQVLYARSVPSGSVCGSAADIKSMSTAAWIRAMHKLHIDAAADTASQLSISKVPAHSQGDAALTAHISDKMVSTISRIHTPPPDDDDDDEYELAVDLTETAITAGQEAYRKGDYNEAEAMLREGVTQLGLLPGRLRSRYSLNDIHFQLAACAYHQHDLQLAEAALLSIVERQSTSQRDAGRKLDAGTLLAQAYVKQNKLKLAESVCTNVYQTRRRLLGKDSEACYQSIALLWRIHDLSGAHDRATLCQGMLPLTLKDQYCLEVSSLCPVISNHVSDQEAESGVEQHWSATEHATSPPSPSTHTSPSATNLQLAQPTSTAGDLISLCTFDAIRYASADSFVAIGGGGRYICVSGLNGCSDRRWQKQTQIPAGTELIAMSKDGKYCAWHLPRKHCVCVTLCDTLADRQIISWKEKSNAFDLRFDEACSMVFAVSRDKIRGWNLTSSSRVMAQGSRVTAFSISKRRSVAWIEDAEDALYTDGWAKRILCVAERPWKKPRWRARFSRWAAGPTWNEDGTQLAGFADDEVRFYHLEYGFWDFNVTQVQTLSLAPDTSYGHSLHAIDTLGPASPGLWRVLGTFWLADHVVCLAHIVGQDVMV